MSWKIFSGIEAEGPNLKEDTLFIEGIAPYSEVAQAIISECPTHIYFGARYKQFKDPSEIDYMQVIRLLKKNFSLIIEGTLNGYDLVYFLNSQEFKDAHFCSVIVNINHIDDILDLLTDWPINKVWFKLKNIETKKVVLIPMRSVQIPDKSLYEKDELIAEG